MSFAETHVDLKWTRYPVRFGEDLESLVASLPEGVRTRRSVVFVDARVLSLHEDRIRRAFCGGAAGPPIEAVATGERAKSVPEYLSICRRLLLDHRVDREGVVFAVGGGVVGDLVGFAAATFMRGVRWVFCPTTVLAMADASVGGKTGINLDGAKNVLGVFHHPEAVLSDLGFLSTLEPRDHRAGLAEALKAAIIRDRGLFEMIEEHPSALLAAASGRLTAVLNHAVSIKARVVEADERDMGERAVLNFGHTIAHALESATGLDRWRHGEAVAIGMACAAALSVECAGLARGESARIVDCLRALELPTEDRRARVEDVMQWLFADKKSAGGEPRFVLTPRIGSASFGHQISQVIVRRVLAGFLGKRT